MDTFKSTTARRSNNYIHGYSRGVDGKPTREIICWWAMIQRCTDKKADNYGRYGGAGVTVCERWRNSFQAFREDMGPKPSMDHSIERIDGTKGYEPGNCRWATRKEQCRNKKNNRNITFQGRTQCVAAWAEELGIHRSTIMHRMNKGLSPEDALRK